MCDERGITACRNKDPVVGVYASHDPLVEVLDEQTYIAQCVVVALAGSPHNSYVVYAFFGQIVHGLCLVVGLLTRRYNDARGILFAYLLSNRIAIANDDVEGFAGGYEVVGSAIANDEGVSIVENL